MKHSPLLLLAVLICGICVAGCTTTPSLGTGESVSSAAYAAAQHPAGNLNETLAEFDTYAESARLKWKVPGMAVAVVKDGNVIFARGYGVKAAGGSDPVTMDTVFQIGSTSKAFTAALAAMEVDRGRMDWTDPVVRYVPDFRMKDPWVTKEFTITDSLSQRSGLDEKWGTDLATLGYSRSEMIHALRYAEPITSFRSEYKYQNIPFIVAAAAVENTSGMSWEENLQTRIFTPLHMAGASSSYKALLSAPDHATLHMLGLMPDGTLGPIPFDPDWEFNNTTYLLGPAGGINANVKDMAAWAIFQLGDGTAGGTKLISPENLAYMHTPRTPEADVMTDSKSYYCLGWNYREIYGTPAVVHHTGESLGHHSVVYLVPDENLGIVVLANEAGPSLPEDVAERFYQLYFGTVPADAGAGGDDPLLPIKALLFPEKPPRPENPAVPLPLSAYTGSYTDNAYGLATVAEADGNLTLTFGKKPVVTLRLSPWDGNTFRATCPEWSWGPGYDGMAVFCTAPDGTLRQVTVPLFIEGVMHRNVTFVRTGAA